MNRLASKEVVVCGNAGADRMTQAVVPYLAGLSMREAHSRDELMEALAKSQPPICLVEHKVLSIDPVKLLKGDQWDSSFLDALKNIVTAYELLPELAERSPETKFVITSHNRGGGISPADKALYKARPEVIKVMGFVNETSNTFYLLKLLSRVYLGKIWKGYEAA
jgi:hypothetical protein